MECFLCNLLCEKPTFRAKREKVKTFTKELWLSCQTFLKARKQFNHKYHDAVLPNTSDDTIIGYHSSCYKEFRVKQKYLSYESSEISTASTSGKTELPTSSISISDTDINPIPSTSRDKDSNSSSFYANNEEDSRNIDEDGNMDDSISVESFANEVTAVNCFFCERKTIKRKGRLIYCRRIKGKIPFLENIKSFATELNDLKMLQKISSEIESVNNSCLSYHNNCKGNYYTQYRTEKNRPATNDWVLKRDFHKLAREKLSHYVKSEIIDHGRALSLAHLKNCFSEFLSDLYKTANVEHTIFSTKTLKDYLKNHFKNQISFVNISNIEFVTSSGKDIETITDEELENILFEQDAQDFALKYRVHILKVKKNPLPQHIDHEILDKGECEIPKWLQIFWSTALKGVSNKKTNRRIERLSSCYSQDSIFSITRGNIKPKKQILFGIAMKSLTGSKKVVDMLNKQGYCISYCNILELETSAAYSCSSKNILCPSGIIPTPTLPCGVAWDNFDRFVETSSGKNTLHDTVGIIYQSTPKEAQLNDIKGISDDELIEIQQSYTTSGHNLSGRRKRSYVAEEFLNLQYAKQTRPQFWHSSTELTETPQTLKVFEKINFAWFLSHMLNVANTPMWVGYNSKIIKDDSTIEKIEYLTQINESPTDPSVIKETMRRSMQIAAECGKEYFCVTYDLAIAKIALRIQSAEQEFKNLFIIYGPFHIWMSLHKAIGKFIDGCGLTNFLVDSGILANGSVSSFLSGKHFNRCKKIHPLLSLALQILHLKRFLQHNPDDLEQVKHYLMQFNEQQNNCPDFDNDECKQLFEAYKNFKYETLQGKHGKTPQIFMMYTTLVEYYLMFDFSIRTADFGLFLYVLPKITNVFFSMNHHNYARYLTIYYDKLLNIETTHPGLLADCKSSFMGIRRTSKPFSRNPIDLTLEQTINADAASRSTGIINLTNSFAARQRWSITHSFRTSVISHVLDFCDMQPKDDVTKDLKKSEIIKSAQKLETLLEIINQCTNPFSSELSQDHLYNVSTGQSVNNEIYEFLSSIETEGEKQRTKFVAEVREAPERFDKVITKNKILNFNYNKSKKVKLGGKVKEIKIQRDIFGRLLYASLTKNIDIEKALAYPLSPIPFSLCHNDGSICKTPKSVIFEELIAKQTENVNPPAPDVHIFDGFYLLHTLKNVADTYGKISKQIFKILVFNKKEVHIIFDKYKKPSIKDFEHDLRGAEDTQYDIRNDNKRPAEFSKLLRSAHFKENFVKFLIDDWKKDEFALWCQGKTVKLNFDKCYVYEVSDGNCMTRSIDHNLSCYHEEADTKIVYHICQFNKNYRVQVHCSDSDIPVIMLANFKYRREDVEIIIDLSRSKKQEYLNINEIYANLGEKLSRSLTACHIFTGNDYNPAFYRKGKKRPFSILKKNEGFQDTFVNLIESTSSDLTTSSELFGKIEEFVCQMYSLKTKNDINRGRYELFEKSYQIKSEKEKVIKKTLIGCDGSSLPPCKQELLQQIKRTAYICSIWCNAHMRCPTIKKPNDYGWTIIDGKFEYYWFDGPQSPSFQELSSEQQEFDEVNDDSEADGDGDSDVTSDEEIYSTDDSDEGCE